MLAVSEGMVGSPKHAREEGEDQSRNHVMVVKRDEADKEP